MDSFGQRRRFVRMMKHLTYSGAVWGALVGLAAASLLGAIVVFISFWSLR